LESFCRGRLNLAGPVPLHAPRFSGRETEYVTDCIKTGWVSSVGSYVNRFENQVAAACDVRFGIATVNGTAALHAALYAHDIGAGDLVLCPALTFVATANAIVYCGATPLFIDSSRETLGIDVGKLAEFLERRCHRIGGGTYYKGRRIAAAIPVHIFGHPVDFAPLAELCSQANIALIEDATEALGSRYRGKPCGSLARVAVFSFNGNKIITTGGGGMLVTDDEILARRLKHLTTTARVPHDWLVDHDEVGFNYRLPNINAALGCAQMEILPELVRNKRHLADLYADVFLDAEEAALFRPRADVESIYWLNALMFRDAGVRDRFLEETNARELQTRACWRLMPELSAFAGAEQSDDLAGARDIAARLVNIPSSPWMVGSSSFAKSAAALGEA